MCIISDGKEHTSLVDLIVHKVFYVQPSTGKLESPWIGYPIYNTFKYKAKGYGKGKFASGGYCSFVAEEGAQAYIKYLVKHEGYTNLVFLRCFIPKGTRYCYGYVDGWRKDIEAVRSERLAPYKKRRY